MDYLRSRMRSTFRGSDEETSSQEGKGAADGDSRQVHPLPAVRCTPGCLTCVGLTEPGCCSCVKQYALLRLLQAGQRLGMAG